MNCDGCPNGNCPKSAAFERARIINAAAQTLRSGRCALQTGDIDDCLIEQVRATCRQVEDRIGPRRMLIELLLGRGELVSAGRELAESMLVWPNDRRLMMLRMHWLLLSGEFRRVVNELHDWLSRTAWDGAAQALAGEAAALDGDHELAAGHFALAAAHTRTRSRRRWLLARAHIEAGQYVAAEQWLADVGRPCPRLEGLLARQRGQLLDASDQLARAATGPHRSALQQQIATRELLEVRRQLGSEPAVRAVVNSITLRHPLAWASAAEALLGIGRSKEAELLAAKLQRRCRTHVLAGSVLVAAAALSGRPAAARRGLRRLNRHRVDLKPAAMAKLWRNGLLSRIVADQCDARRSGSDPHPHLLQPLLERANTVLEQELRSVPRVETRTRGRRLLQLRSTCLTALGRPLDGLRGLDALNEIDSAASDVSCAA